jgi:hypothetical protein
MHVFSDDELEFANRKATPMSIYRVEHPGGPPLISTIYVTRRQTVSRKSDSQYHVFIGHSWSLVRHILEHDEGAKIDPVHLS